jgi:hypothetical protein
MSNNELKNPDDSLTNDQASDNVSARRNFVKNIVAGAVTAGALVGAGNAIAAPSSAASTTSTAQCTSNAVMNIRFNSRKPPTVENIQEAIARGLGVTSCPRCGLGGLDISLILEEKVNPAELESIGITGGGL